MRHLMPAAIEFPDISSILFEIDIGPVHFALHWYALAYIFGFVAGWFLVLRALRVPRLWPAQTPPLSRTEFEDLLTWLILGVILGGRLGYVLFYKPAYFLAHPVEIPMVWQGGMSFHGGFLGVVVAALLWGRRHGKPLLTLGDILAYATPPGLLFGRIANFVNAELWGRPTDMPWGVIFPGEAAQSCATVTAACARHPSQLYEAGLEGLLLGTLLIALVWGARAFRRPGLVMGLFFAGYGLSRFVVEFYRVADAQFTSPTNPEGNVLWILSMGQLLSLPMILVGLFFVLRARRA